MSNTRKWNTGIVARRRIYFTADNKVYAFTVPTGTPTPTPATTRDAYAYSYSYRNTNTDSDGHAYSCCNTYTDSDIHGNANNPGDYSNKPRRCGV